MLVWDATGLDSPKGLSSMPPLKPSGGHTGEDSPGRPYACLRAVRAPSHRYLARTPHPPARGLVLSRTRASPSRASLTSFHRMLCRWNEHPTLPHLDRGHREGARLRGAPDAHDCGDAWRVAAVAAQRRTDRVHRLI